MLLTSLSVHPEFKLTQFQVSVCSEGKEKGRTFFRQHFDDILELIPPRIDLPCDRLVSQGELD